MFKIVTIGECEILEPLVEGTFYLDKYIPKNISPTSTTRYDLSGLAKEYKFFYHLPMIVKMGIDPAKVFFDTYYPYEKDALIKIISDKIWFQPIDETILGKNGHFIFGCASQFSSRLFQYLEIINLKQSIPGDYSISKVYRVIHQELTVPDHCDTSRIYPIDTFTFINDNYVSYWDKSDGDVWEFNIIKNVFDIPKPAIKSKYDFDINGRQFFIRRN